MKAISSWLFSIPWEIPGIGNAYFLRSAMNAMRKYRGEDELDADGFSCRSSGNV